MRESDGTLDALGPKKRHAGKWRRIVDKEKRKPHEESVACHVLPAQEGVAEPGQGPEEGGKREGQHGRRPTGLHPRRV